MPGHPSAAVDEREEHKGAFRRFIASAFKGYEPADDEDIFETGFVDSLFAMELITFLESTFEVVVDTDDLELDNFRTIDALAALVERKRATP